MSINYENNLKNILPLRVRIIMKTDEN